jgi:hypothetical protein
METARSTRAIPVWTAKLRTERVFVRNEAILFFVAEGDVLVMSGALVRECITGQVAGLVRSWKRLAR